MLSAIDTARDQLPFAADCMADSHEFAEAERMKQAENLFRRAMGKMQNAVAASCFEVRPRPKPQTHASRFTRPPDCFKSGS